MVDDAVGEGVWAALGTVIDPEIGLDIVTLGLVYDVEVDEAGMVRIRYTLTTQGCPMAGLIRSGIEATVYGVQGVSHVDAELVWEPRWDAGMIQEGAW